MNGPVSVNVKQDNKGASDGAWFLNPGVGQPGKPAVPLECQYLSVTRKVLIH